MRRLKKGTTICKAAEEEKGYFLHRNISLHFYFNETEQQRKQSKTNDIIDGQTSRQEPIQDNKYRCVTSCEVSVALGSIGGQKMAISE